METLENLYKYLQERYDFIMLPEDYRLKKRSAFKATYKSGKSFHKDGITMFCGREKNNDTPTKIGFVVSKKIHKRAVRRNRIKRLMRESLRLLIKEKGFSTKYMSIIFVATSKLLDRNFAEVDSGIKKLVEKL